jgi:4-hydroxybenzoate polyprenyltransferase
MLARATEEPIAAEPVSPAVARVTAVAQTLAYASLALVVTFCAALLLGILGHLVG